ncbi:MAG: hypothetical protein K2O62_03355, partial [Clostridia bacterium]|nr:hypothetical protein [Clostridia bacterium]
MSASADTPVKQSAAYFDLNGSGTILNAFEGKQQEYVYFGMNGSSVKWRVLAKNDSKYGIGNNLLLWANSSIAADKFNIYYNNPEYAFWGTSYLRAKLNGGSYVAAVNNTTDVPDVSLGIAEDNSWYATLFNTEERAAVLSSKSYATDNYGIDTSDTYHQENWRFYKQNIVSDSDGANGKYYRDRINATSHPASQYASITGTSPNEGVSEMTGGDKLFILDYYDLNNVLYGFGDGGLTYALKINPSWTPSSNWFPAHYDGGQGSVRSTYLANEGDYWVRSVCRAINTGSNAMIVSSTGTMGANILTSSFGVRPAFNLDTSKVAYVTTVKPVSGWTDMSQTSVKPEYKLYIKDSGYTSVKAAVAEKDGTLNIRYNNPTGKTGGKLILLLSDKTKDDGAVAYQTTIAMNSTSAADNVFTTVALPSGVSLSTHNLAMMYASANGGDKTETVYCSYDVNSGIDAPNDITTGLTYEADKSKWIVDLPASDNYAWLDLNIYNNPAFIKEVSISYKDNLGNPATTVGENQVIA